MAVQRPVLVTGPTGTVGGPLVDLLVRGELPVIAAVRDPARGAGPVACRELDFERPETFDSALAGVGRVFLMCPPAVSDTKRYLRPFVRAAERHGVEHVVFLSLMGVNRVMPHWQVEQDLRESSLGWTLLRPSFFAQNLETAYRDDIRDRDAIRLPAGRGKTSFVDTRDVATVAAHVLTDPAPHLGRAYTLTGPAAQDYHHVASMLSAELGRTVTYQPLSLLGYRRELRRAAMPPAYITVQLVINIVARAGLAARTTDTVARLLGRPATPMATYIHDRRRCWAPTLDHG